MKKIMLIIFVIFTNIQSIFAQESTSEIISSQGFTLNSLLRGVLGMVVLVLISYILSANRKAINWRTVGFGLGSQIILAIGVLKVSFVQSFFEWVGSLFIAV
jgi:CNT family concentrative nucleoside transporter